VFVHPTAFGYPTPTATMQSRLANVVALAASHGLRVELSLFDGYVSYRDTAGSDQWAQAILAPYANDPRIAFVEVHNEINPSDSVAMSWLAQITTYLHSAGLG